ncbi:MAG: gamma-glutamyl-gamma-aminobutyrate hydrolase family protein [Rhodobacteraceae bacterium]|nr:MAG: gamma-glutamyl-gamma-aminobutyrate hydrolase family protein [Paracoccaceae bacterium]
MRRRPVIGVSGSHLLAEGTYPVQAAGMRNLEAIAEVADCLPIIVPGMPEASEIGELLDLCDGFLLTGGRANVHPSHYGHEETEKHGMFDTGRDGVVLPLVQAAIAEGWPVFGVCRGIQEMNVALGGVLHPEVRELPGKMNHRMPPGETDPEVIFRKRHVVRLTPGGEFARLLGVSEIVTNSLHGQAIVEWGERVVVEGVAEDGVIEAISVKDAPSFALGVQWHAEWDAENDPVHRALFEAFGSAARARAAARGR